MGATMVYDPWHSRMPWSDDELLHARSRPERRETPKPGDVVLYRHDHHGDVTDAYVMAVQDPDEGGDPNLLLPDPWVTLTLDTLWGPVRTREARVRGSAGWMHPEDGLL